MPPPEFLIVRAGGGKRVRDVGDITDALHCDMVRRGSITLGRPGMSPARIISGYVYGTAGIRPRRTVTRPLDSWSSHSAAAWRPRNCLPRTRCYRRESPYS